MISLTSKMTMDSKLLPGARVHLRKFNVQNRAHIVLALAEYRAKVNTLYRQMIPLAIVPDETDETGAVTKPGDSPDVRERKTIERLALQTEIAALEDAYIKPALLRAYVVSIDGVELDGEPLSAETLVSGAHPSFADEVYTFMEANNGLPPFVSSSSPSPSPSLTLEDGATPIDQASLTPSTTATAA